MPKREDFSDDSALEQQMAGARDTAPQRKEDQPQRVAGADASGEFVALQPVGPHMAGERVQKDRYSPERLRRMVIAGKIAPEKAE